MRTFGNRDPRRALVLSVNGFAYSLGMGLLLGSMLGCRAGQLQFESARKETVLVELFTSEGCSSCPPAEASFSRLKEDPGLWQSFVPIAWHVDYWNHLGWKDRFSSSRYTERQRGYAASWQSDSVYTPAFVVNGQEWHGGIAGRALAMASSPDAGVLTAKTTDRQRFSLIYKSSSGDRSEWEAHVALLGCGISSKVGAGENSGRDLRHDFVVLEELSESMQVEKDAARAEVALKSPPIEGVPRRAIAIWVNRRGQLAPVQATGGWF